MIRSLIYVAVKMVMTNPIHSREKKKLIRIELQTVKYRALNIYLTIAKAMIKMF